MKQNLPSVRQFGQSSIVSSFLSKSRPPNESTEAKASKKSVSLSEFLNRKIEKTNGKLIRVKQSSFSSIGFDKKQRRSEKEEAGGEILLDGAVFRGFNPPSIKDGDDVGELQKSKSNGDVNDSRKRKNPFGLASGEDVKPRAAKYLVVLGDDPRPKPKRIEKKLEDDRGKPFYNHYENGRGWWDCNRAGVDSEEVGCSDTWEGMGSTTLGGLEWH